MANDPWGNASTAQVDKESSVDWTQEVTDAPIETANNFDILNPFENVLIPFDSWVTNGIDWLVINFREVFLVTKVPIDIVLKSVESFLLYLNPYVVILFFVLLALQVSTWKLSLGTLIIFFCYRIYWSMGRINDNFIFSYNSSILFYTYWTPSGIWSAKSDTADKILRPLLDAMQTTPAFVYLIPIVMLFGIVMFQAL